MSQTLDVPLDRPAPRRELGLLWGRSLLASMGAEGLQRKHMAGLPHRDAQPSSRALRAPLVSRSVSF